MSFESRYAHVPFGTPFSRALACRDCGSLIEPASVDVHDTWHDRIAELLADADQRRQSDLERLERADG